jgi:hypothetical protein
VQPVGFIVGIIVVLVVRVGVTTDDVAHRYDAEHRTGLVEHRHGTHLGIDEHPFDLAQGVVGVHGDQVALHQVGGVQLIKSSSGGHGSLHSRNRAREWFFRPEAALGLIAHGGCADRARSSTPIAGAVAPVSPGGSHARHRVDQRPLARIEARVPPGA